MRSYRDFKYVCFWFRVLQLVDFSNNQLTEMVPWPQEMPALSVSLVVYVFPAIVPICSEKEWRDV